MSLFIKCNIGLPQGCKSCPFNYTDVCIASNKGIDTRAFVHLRHPDCPMVELPTPHGRLVDADEHIKLLKENHCGERCRRNHNCFSCGIDMYIRIVENEPTVIKAEVSE